MTMLIEGTTPEDTAAHFAEVAEHGTMSLGEMFVEQQERIAKLEATVANYAQNIDNFRWEVDNLQAELAVTNQALRLAFAAYYGGPGAAVETRIAELMEQARKEMADEVS